MGYYLSKEARGKGVATRAGNLLCNFAFDVLKCPAINMGIKEGNARSLRLAERLGFIWIGSDRKVIGTGPETNIVLLRREAGVKKAAAE